MAEVKKVLEALVGITLVVAGMTSQMPWLTAAGALEFAKVVSEEVTE